MFKFLKKKQKPTEKKYLSFTRTSAMISFDIKEATDSAMRQFGHGTVFPKEMADELRASIEKDKERSFQLYDKAIKESLN